MSRDDRNSAIAAAVIIVGFGLFAYFLPTIMLAIGVHSQIGAAAMAAFFIVALFLVLWLRSRYQKRRKN